MTGRHVVLLCGPPGAGKTTAAHASGLPVYDRDDAHWQSEANWNSELAKLGRDRSAQAVVIRSGATSSARARTARMIAATQTYVVLAPREELRRRVRDRGREDMVRTLMGIDQWLSRYERDDKVRDFLGWAALDAQLEQPGTTSTDW